MTIKVTRLGSRLECSGLPIEVSRGGGAWRRQYRAGQSVVIISTALRHARGFWQRLRLEYRKGRGQAEAMAKEWWGESVWLLSFP